MNKLNISILAGAALLFASAPTHLEAASPGQWSYSGFTQWHPNDGRTGLGTFGTQCYFCKADTSVAPPPPPPRIPTPVVAAPVHKAPAPAPVPVLAKKCPEMVKGATVSTEGCWVIKNLNFRTNSAAIEPKGVHALQEAIDLLKKNPNLHVEIQGHTDNVGKAPYNKKLSLARANSVMTHLVKHGIQKKRLSAAGHGLERPVDSNDTETGRAANRRVEMHIVR